MDSSLNMAIFSPLRLRRMADRSTELTQKFITFQISQQWCALPIEELVKVIIMEEISHDSQPLGIKLTQYKGQQLIVWDVGNLIFGKSSFRLPTISNQHLLIGRLANDDVIGIPIDAPPATQAVLASAIQPTTDLPGITAIVTAGHQHYVLDLAAIEHL